MFNLDDRQRRVIGVTAVSAVAFWLCNQIADTKWMQQVWFVLGIAAVCLGAARVRVLEAAKSKQS
jgi:hypothetical protein